MNTIEAYERDIGLQIDFLRGFKTQKPLGLKRQSRMLFCGTGDSMASAMTAESFSDFRAKALDPLDLIKNKKLAHGKSVYFVSISGNTVSNIRAARIVKQSTAVTRNAASRLTNVCGGLIRLQYGDSNVLTSGSIGFLASMLACVSLVFRVKIKDPQKIFGSAVLQTKKISLQNKIYLVGNQHTYSIAMYAAAKLYEIFGMDAHYERIEQFSHMGLFSAKKGDTVLIFEKTNKHNKQLVSKLRKLGLSVFNPSIDGDKISQVIFYTFVSQLIALNHAKKKHLKNCYFVTEKKIRNASSAMIY